MDYAADGEWNIINISSLQYTIIRLTFALKNIISPKLTIMIDNQIENLQTLREYLQQESCQPQEPFILFGECCGCPQTQIING